MNQKKKKKKRRETKSILRLDRILGNAEATPTGNHLIGGAKRVVAGRTGDEADELGQQLVDSVAGSEKFRLREGDTKYSHTKNAPRPQIKLLNARPGKTVSRHAGYRCEDQG